MQSRVYYTSANSEDDLSADVHGAHVGQHRGIVGRVGVGGVDEAYPGIAESGAGDGGGVASSGAGRGQGQGHALHGRRGSTHRVHLHNGQKY